MNTTLQTFTRPGQNKNQFDVHWKAFHSHGAVHINVLANVEDKHIVAELFAIHHLVINRKIIGDNRFGADLQLQVSSGAIRKLCLGVSSKTHLLVWCDLLKKRLRDADIVVSKDQAFIETRVTQEEAIDCFEPPIETIRMYGVGDIVLSTHVLEQFRERNNNKNFGNAMRQMIKELTDCMVRQVTLPERVLRHKSRKYAGQQQHVKYFQNMRTSRQFVVAMPPNEIPVLLTAYSRELHA